MERKPHPIFGGEYTVVDVVDHPNGFVLYCLAEFDYNSLFSAKMFAEIPDQPEEVIAQPELAHA